MRQPSNTNQSFSPSDKTKIIIIVLFLAVLLVVLGVLLGIVIKRSGFKFSLPVMQIQSTPTLAQLAVAPAMIIPTPDCEAPTLAIGSTTFQIQPIQFSPDGTLPIPADGFGIAYWVNGTNTNYVFGLSPTQENLALQTSLTTRDIATIFLGDCTTKSFNISTIDVNQLSNPGLLDQSMPGISVFVQTDPTAAGFVIKGSPAEETVSVINTPIPDESGVLAEISIQDIMTSSDGKTILVDITVLNYGQTPFTFSSDNISLTSQDSVPLILSSIEPSIPKLINPGITENFLLTFPRPSTSIATLKIFTVEYDIEGY